MECYNKPRLKPSTIKFMGAPELECAKPLPLPQSTTNVTENLQSLERWDLQYGLYS